MRCLSKRRSVGFNVETVEYKNISFTVWDVGGQDKVKHACCTTMKRKALDSSFMASLLSEHTGIDFCR